MNTLRFSAIKEKYTPLIKEAQTRVLPKKEAKAQIKVLKDQAAKEIKVIKEKYKKDKEKIPKANLEEIKKQVAQIEAKYNQLIKEKNDKIAELKAQTAEKIKTAPKANLSEEEKQKLKEKTKALKQERKQKLGEIKAKIAEAKAINKSKDAWLASQKMQMIFKDPISSLNPRMTVREIIGEGLIIRKTFSAEEINKGLRSTQVGRIIAGLRNTLSSQRILGWSTPKNRCRPCSYYGTGFYYCG